MESKDQAARPGAIAFRMVEPDCSGRWNTVLAHALQLRVRADHVLAHVLRVRARVADPLDAVDRVDQPQQLGEARALAQVAAVGVDVLPEQRHLLYPIGRHRPHVLQQALRFRRLIGGQGLHPQRGSRSTRSCSRR